MRAAASDDLRDWEAYIHDKRKALRESVIQSNPPKTGRKFKRSITGNVLPGQRSSVYVSLSRARQVMHLLKNSKAALKEAVARPSERVSAR